MQGFAKNIDADMRIHQIGQPETQHHQHRMDVPFQILNDGGDRIAVLDGELREPQARHVQLTGHDIEHDDGDQGQNQPASGQSGIPNAAVKKTAPPQDGIKQHSLAVLSGIDDLRGIKTGSSVP